MGQLCGVNCLHAHQEKSNIMACMVVNLTLFYIISSHLSYSIPDVLVLRFPVLGQYDSTF